MWEEKDSCERQLILDSALENFLERDERSNAHWKLMSEGSRKRSFRMGRTLALLNVVGTWWYGVHDSSYEGEEVLWDCHTYSIQNEIALKLFLGHFKVAKTFSGIQVIAFNNHYKRLIPNSHDDQLQARSCHSSLCYSWSICTPLWTCRI